MTTPAAPNPTHIMRTIGGVRLPLRVEFGQTQMPIGDVLQLAPGSVIRLNRRHGEPQVLYANDRAIAEGNIVQITGSEELMFKVTRVLEAERREAVGL